MRLLLASLVAFTMTGLAAPSDYHTIEVLDAQTQRGVPLVKLETTSRVRYVTDSAGRVAFHEPGLMNTDVFFTIRSHGYEAPKDGFGLTGIKVKSAAGKTTQLKLKRKNIAERLYRTTGEGIYRDTELLGLPVPLNTPPIRAGVTGQDSAQVVIYKNQARWFWGDTSHLNYGLGNFRTCGAVVDLTGLDTTKGIALNYFTNENGLSKQMCPFEPKDGVVWIDGLTTVRDSKGQERMVTRFTRLKGLSAPLEHGLAIWNDEQSIFERLARFDLKNQWQCPRGQAFTAPDGYIYFAAPFPTVRVKAQLETLKQQANYEAWTPIKDGQAFAGKDTALVRNTDNSAYYRWTTKAPPLTTKEEQELLRAGRLLPSDLRWSPADSAGGKSPVMHAGSVRWNNYRKRHIMIATEIGGTSMLGEVWYAEAEQLTGPWNRATKIVTHENYDFYNSVHHAFLDQDGGRRTFFEGTYTYTFSGQTNATPRYEYNQILYSLDLSDPRLRH
ncbi:MAG TPA: hypothetical protein VEH27_03460 [Methylomirabilota bacterium]|nr:hypothetical protein [Methylomirabilota bacterium]